MPTDDEFRRVAEDVRMIFRSLAREARDAVDGARARGDWTGRQAREDARRLARQARYNLRAGWGGPGGRYWGGPAGRHWGGPGWGGPGWGGPGGEDWGAPGAEGWGWEGWEGWEHGTAADQAGGATAGADTPGGGSGAARSSAEGPDGGAAGTGGATGRGPDEARDSTGSGGGSAGGAPGRGGRGGSRPAGGPPGPGAPGAGFGWQRLNGPPWWAPRGGQAWSRPAPGPAGPGAKGWGGPGARGGGGPSWQRRPYWTPGAGGPPAAGPGPQAVRRTPRPPLRHRWDGPTVFAMLAVLFGVAWIFGASHAVTIPLEAVVAVGLMVLGAALVVTGRTDWSLSRRHWPVWLGIGMILVLFATSSTFGLHNVGRDLSIGDTRYTAPTSAEQLPSVIHGGFGTFRVDLSPLQAPLSEARTVEVDAAAGVIDLQLPNGVPVHLDARLLGGVVCAAGQGVLGRGADVHVDQDFPGQGGPVLTLDVHDAGGQVRINGGCR